MDGPELLWRQYSLHFDLYKHYLKLTIEFNVFYYAITGAIVSYYLPRSSEPLMEYALLLPFAMSILFFVFFVYGAVLMRITRTEVFAIRDSLGLKSAPELAVLIALLYIFAVLTLAVAVGLGILIWCK